MKNLFFTFILSLSFVVSAQQTRKVFFVGNSYTSTGNIPNLVKQIAADSGDELIYTAHTPGGATFQQHATNQTVISTIQQGDWDFVVLQEQSQLPSFPDDQVEEMVLSYAEQLSDMIKQYNPCAQVNFYMTWGRKNGDAQNCPGWPPVCTYEGMDDLLFQRYMLMAELNDASVSPVGRVWRYIRENFPETELYSSDGSHPSAVGSMAAAYSFYTTLFKKSPYDSEFSGNISTENIGIIKEAVQQTIFNDMDQWFLFDFMPHSDFEYLANGTEVSFTNLSTNSETFLWNFGDGSTSTEQNPVHSYAQAGNYTVKLSVEKCGESDFSEKQLELLPLSNSDLTQNSFKIYPNPATNYLNIQSKNEIQKIEIFDLNGQKIRFQSVLKNGEISIDLKPIKTGTYVLLIKTKDGNQSHQFIRK